MEDAFGGIWIQPYYGLFSYYDPQDKVLKPARQTQGDQEADYHAPGLGYHIDKHRNLWLCCKSGFDQLTFSPRNYTLLRQERAGQYEILNTIRGLLSIRKKGSGVHRNKVLSNCTIPPTDTSGISPAPGKS